MLDILNHLKLPLLIYFEEIHISIELYQPDSVLVSEVGGKNDSFDDVVGYICIDDEPKAPGEDTIDGLILVVWSNVSVADVRNSVKAPVEGVEILYFPVVGINGGVSG